MSEKTFVVSHAKARAPLTITGKTLKDALKKEGLNPERWRLVAEIKAEEPPAEP